MSNRRRRSFPIISQEGGAKAPPFPIIIPQAGGGKRTRSVVFLTKKGKQVSFAAATSKVSKRYRSSGKNRRSRTEQRGRGFVGDYLKSELGDVASTVAPLFVNAGVAEGRNLATKEFRYLKSKLTRRQCATHASTQVPTQQTFAYDV